MTSIYDYNATPSSNTGSPPTGFGTGQPPSNVRVVVQDIFGEVTEFVHSAVAAGSADALTVTLTNVPASLTDGMEIHVRAAAANATTTPTLNLNSLGAKTITKGGGVALVAGDIPGNLAEMDLRYNFANTRWELLNPAKGGAASVVGPSSSTDGDVALFNGATGLIIKDSGFTLGQLLRSYLTGLILSTAGGSGTMSMTAGTSMSDDQTTIMVTGSFSKTTASWAVGSGNGGLDTGAIASGTWYHFYQIKRTDTGVTDFLFSLSATSPTMPANYTKRRRIGSWPTDGSSHWAPILQQTDTGDLFQWNSANPLDVNTTNPGTAAVTATLNGGGSAAGGVPTGIDVIAILNVVLQVNSGAGGSPSVYISDLATPDQAASGTAAPLAQVIATVQAANNFSAGQVQVRTNTSAQIRYRLGFSDANSAIRIYTTGWIDRRGRDA